MVDIVFQVSLELKNAFQLTSAAEALPIMAYRVEHTPSLESPGY